MIRHKVRKRSTLAVTSVVGAACVAMMALGGCGGGTTGRVGLDSTLTGAQEVPPVVTTATGTGSVSLSPSNGTIVATLTTTGLTNVTAAHIHVGAPGAEGDPIFTLYTTADGPFPATLTKTLTAADFTPAPGIATFRDALGVIRGGGAYFNVHTTANPDGEIRGQITP